ncbi:MAG: peptide chain release factor aRF-1 [Candidatus Aenigmarchaeota archaeon]|nr:peptide chain release factor aRF-1 [Candidatus Aenigmarchaeota archaeon]
MTDETAERVKGRFKLKKLVEKLAAIKGRHTELVSVYVPANYSLHEISSQLRQEEGTAENIKSKGVRKNVTTSLDKIIRHLQLYKKTPENGMAIFCGNVSEKEGEALIELVAIEPPEPVKVKMYWCDQKFVLEPLAEMIEEREVYGIITVDRSEADIGLLVGKKIEPLVHMESLVPGKTRAGGQSSARFSRVREGLLNDWFKQFAEAVNKVFEGHKETIGIIVGGPGPVKEMFLKEGYLHDAARKKILGTVDTSYTGEYGLHEALERGKDLIKEASVLKEKKILQKFFEELQKPHGMAVYGFENVVKVTEQGAADIIIASERLSLEEVEYECDCGMKKRFVNLFEKNKQTCGTCKKQMKILGEKDLLVALEELANNYGTKLEVVSADTREGQQFFELGGVAALLRYNI